MAWVPICLDMLRRTLRGRLQSVSVPSSLSDCSALPFMRGGESSGYSRRRCARGWRSEARADRNKWPGDAPGHDKYDSSQYFVILVDISTVYLAVLMPRLASIVEGTDLGKRH